MSASPVFGPTQMSDEALSKRVVEMSLEGQTDSFEWHCLDEEVQRRLAEDYVDSTAAAAASGRFKPVLVAKIG